MKKYLFFTICGLGLLGSAIAQTGSLAESKTNESKKVVDVKENKLRAMNNTRMDETEIFNITGISSSVFTVSNVSDGTEKSYNHNLRVVMGLSIAENKPEKYQLVFYNPNEKIPFAVANEMSSFSVFYPIGLYDSIREKLEQALAAKKKVQLKIIRKPDGYREGTLIF